MSCIVLQLTLPLLQKMNQHLLTNRLEKSTVLWHKCCVTLSRSFLGLWHYSFGNNILCCRTMARLPACPGLWRKHQCHLPAASTQLQPPVPGVVWPEPRSGRLDRHPEETGRLCQLLQELGSVQGWLSVHKGFIQANWLMRRSNMFQSPFGVWKWTKKFEKRPDC